MLKSKKSYVYTEVDPWEIAPRFTDLLANTGVQFFKDRVKCFCPSDALGMNPPTVSGAGGTVHLESGLLIEYDWYTFVQVYLRFALLLDGCLIQLQIVANRSTYS